MPDEQVDTVVENKLEELDEFLKLIEEFAAGDCHGMGPGAQFVAGFGKHMASSFKQYIEMNRDLLAVPATTEVKSAAG
jgi:hypothetical protein